MDNPRQNLQELFSKLQSGAMDKNVLDSLKQNPTPKSALGRVQNQKDIELDGNTEINSIVGRFFPEGLTDPAVSIVVSPPRSSGKTTENRKLSRTIFKRDIHESIEYYDKLGETSNDWDDSRLNDISDRNIITSLNDNFLKTARGVRKSTGDYFTDHDIASIVRARVFDNSLSGLTLEYFRKLGKDTKNLNLPNIVQSQDKKVNEVAALALINNYKMPLDPNRYSGTGKNLVPLWKTIFSDVDSHVYVNTESGIIDKLYPSEDGGITIETSGGTLTTTYEVQDGDHLIVETENGNYPLHLSSEKDHAYLIPDHIRYKALKLLGGDPSWKLSTYTDYTTGSEFTYDTSSSNGIRSADYFIFQIVPTSVETTISDKSDLIKKTKVKYTRINGLTNINNLIKYKLNYRVLPMEYDDLIFDYAGDVDGARGVYLEQEDIVFDNDMNIKNYPIYTRQIPWYLVLFPTDNIKYNPKKLRSKITSLDVSGNIHREIVYSPSFDPKYTHEVNTKFVQTKLDFEEGGTGVYPNSDNQARSMALDFTGDLANGYTGERRTTRRKSVPRKIKEIITEITTNYVTEKTGSTKVLMAFDVFSRLKFHEMNEFLEMDSPEFILPLMENGHFGARILPATRGSGIRKTQETRIRYRDPDADPDVYGLIKSKSDGTGFVPDPEDPPSQDTLYTGIIAPPDGL